MTNPKKGLILAGFAGLAIVLLLLPAMAGEKVPDVNAQQKNTPVQAKAMIAGTGTETRFYPSTLNIKTGDSVVFINQDGTAGGIAHSILSTDSTTGVANDLFDSNLLHVGQSYTITFDKPGVYTYTDPTYPSAVGQIIVAP